MMRRIIMRPNNGAAYITKVFYFIALIINEITENKTPKKWLFSRICSNPMKN